MLLLPSGTTSQVRPTCPRAPVVDSLLPSTHGTRHHLSPARSMLVQISSSTLPTPDWGLQHVLAPPLGHQARGRRPSIATPPFICGQLVEGEQDTRVEGELLPGLKPTVRARRVLVLERMSLHVGPHSSLDWLPSSMTVADLSANRGLVSSRSRHLGYPSSPDTSSSKVLPLQTILPMSSDDVAKSKSKRSFDFERWARDSVIATSHMITKLAHARTFFRCIRCRCLGHQERHCHFWSSFRLVELSPLSNMIILNNRGLGVLR